jgi:putative SOS response-associated peptidase YedK
MCARFYRFKDLRDFYIRFRVGEILSLLGPQYNIAISEPALIIPATDCERKAVAATFGLMNPWRDGVGPLFNMKAESFINKPGFKKYVQHQRCLVPADGFIEWLKTKTESLGFGFSLKNNEEFGFAGVYDDDKFAIITTEANTLVAPVKHRMPVLLRREDEDLWLDSKITEFSKLIPLLCPYNPEEMASVRLSKAINSPKNKSPEVLTPIEQ